MVGKMSDMTGTYGLAVGAAFGAGVMCYTALSQYFPDAANNELTQKKKRALTHVVQQQHQQQQHQQQQQQQHISVSTAESQEHAANHVQIVSIDQPLASKSNSRFSSRNGSRAGSSRTSPRAGDTILTGIDAATTAAYILSDIIFAYEAGDGNAVVKLVDAKKEAAIENAFGRVPNAAFVSTRSGAGRVVVGAAGTREAKVAVFVPSQSLQLMLPSLKTLSKKAIPCVLHVTAVKLDESLSYATDFSGIFLIRDTGVAIIASYSPQEAYQLAIVSHLLAKRCSMPVAHVFDAEVVARGSGTVSTLEEPPIGIFDVEQPLSTHSDPVAELKALFAEMAPHFNNNEFKLFETPLVAPRAVHVIVAFGAGVGQLRRAAKRSKTPVHIIQVRVYRPWSAKAFIASLPNAVRQLSRGDSWSISVACICSRNATQQSLVADIATSMNSALWTGPSPKIVKCTILPEAGGLSYDGAQGIVHNLVSSDNYNLHNQSFVVDHPSLHKESDSCSVTTPSLCVWGNPASDVKGIVSAVGERLLQVSDLYHNSIVDRDSYHPKEPVLGRMVLYSDATTPAYYPETYCTIVLLDPTLLETHATDIASCIGQGSRLVIALSEGFETAEVENLPQEIAEAIVTHAAKIETFAPTGAGAISNTTDIALAALHSGEPTHTALNSVTIPARWRRASFIGSRSPSRFKRRMTLTTTPEVSESSSLLSSTAAIVNEHSLSWNVVFNNQGHVQENLRPEPHQVFHVKCTKNIRLTPLEYARNVFHLEFDTTGTNLKYHIGDALGVFGQNDVEEVKAFIEFYSLRAQDFVALPRGDSQELLTVEQLLKQRIDLFGKPSQKFYAFLAHYAKDSYEQKKLKWMGSEDKEAFKLRQYEAVTFADVLTEFKSAHPPLLDLIQAIPAIKPRHYSISSSMKMHPNSVHLLVVAVDWETPKGRKRYGQCTRYLATLDPSQGDVWVTVDIKPSVCQLPPDPMQPVVCAGLGTGLAPYRAFVQERTFLKSQGVEVGPMSLYFGARHRSEEYLYGDDLDEAHRNGIITDLRLAFSRDQKEKVYIQHLILEDKEKLAKYFKQDKGFFYMCGPTWPVPDVKQAICEGLVSSATEKFTMEDADDYLEELKEEGRYILEVY